MHLKSVQADVSPKEEEISHTFTNSILVSHELSKTKLEHQ